ncbi:hypothetical protein AtEden1_Chr4g0289021 [Arabidopsis thaliana]|uniref:Uncharacterized protein n=1 Tax=Arabidopsis thaliana TaxID=3702 RepID=A0A5S9XTW5_ARATH|nr:unnamed protein product [Arabidopsis thaliana]
MTRAFVQHLMTLLAKIVDSGLASVRNQLASSAVISGFSSDMDGFFNIFGRLPSGIYWLPTQ